MIKYNEYSYKNIFFFNSPLKRPPFDLSHSKHALCMKISQKNVLSVGVMNEMLKHLSFEIKF